MTVSTFYPDLDGHINCQHATYLTARSGGGTFTVNDTGDGSTYLPWGQSTIGGPAY